MLKEKLKSMAEATAAKLSDDLKATVGATTKAVADSVATRKIPKVGDALPAFALPDSHGNAQKSADLVGAGHLVVTFFRGGWWPYCVVELEALNDIVAPLKESGCGLVAISPQTSDKNRELIEKTKLDFEILFDKDNAYAKKLDLVHGFIDELKEIYGGFGIDVGAANGNQVWELPIPGRMVIGSGHSIRAAEFNANYTERPEPEATLALVPDPY